MKKKILILISFLLQISYIYGQGEPCRTSTSDNLKGKKLDCHRSLCDIASTRNFYLDTSNIPTKTLYLYWNVFTDDNGLNGTDTAQIRVHMNTANQILSSAKIKLEVAGIRLISSTVDNNASAMLYDNDSSFKVQYAVRPRDFINVYVIDNIGGLYYNYGRFPFETQLNNDSRAELSGIVLCRPFMESNYIPQNFQDVHLPLINKAGLILTHELGHCLGLLHTFQNWNNCTSCHEQPDSLGNSLNGDVAGDLVADTKPFYFLGKYECDYSEFDDVCTNGTYSNFEQDNVMSYSSCATRFSSGQIARMHCMLETYRSEWQSAVLGIDDVPKMRFGIYPNPVSTSLNITSSVSNYSVVLLNPEGRIVSMYDNIDGEIKIDFSSLSAGVYYLKILAEDSQVDIKKVVKL